MINLFSLEVLIGLILGIIIGIVTKSLLSKKVDLGDYATNLKNLTEKIEKYQEDNILERGAVKEKFENILRADAEFIKSAQELKNTLVSGGGQKQGAWGELVLNHILKENLRFTEGEEYRIHKGFSTEEGTKIPDVIINFPDGRHAIIDSKVSLTAWEEYINANDEVTKKDALERHKASLKNHIDTLAKKNYQSIEDLNTIDTIIMFCPDQSAISDLPREGGSKLMDYALKNKVTLCTPSILYYMLKTAEYSWKADKQSKHVQDIIDLANRVSSQAVDIYGSAQKAQESISKTSESVGEVMKKIKDGRGSFLSKINKMNTLGLSPKKQISIEVEEDEPAEADSKTKSQMFKELGKKGGSREDFVKLHHRLKRK